MDMQNRVGSKVGSGGQLSSSQQAANQRERLRKLALETIDLSKDPYLIRTNVGTFECKLCLTVHPNEGNYLAHTQGKRHQSNVGRRAALAAKKEAEQGGEAEGRLPLGHMRACSPWRGMREAGRLQGGNCGVWLQGQHG